jgi:RNA polymerase-binding transcription factor DksA
MNRADIKASLERERALTLSQRDRLRRDVADILAAVADVATDDEHDPEGATIAYERSRTSALIDQAEIHLREIGQALDRLDAGSYGICSRCRGPIAAERLQMRPAVQTCIVCAAQASSARSRRD